MIPPTSARSSEWVPTGTAAELGIYPDAVCADHTSIRPEQAESLLMHDAEFCLSDRARMPVEYRAMLCGRPQPTTNGRHYIDLDCDDT